MQIHSFGKYFFYPPGTILPGEIYQRVNIVCFERNNWFGPRNVRSVNKSQPFEWKMICRNWRGNAKNGGLEKKPFGMAKYFYYFSPVASFWMSDFHRCRRWGKKTPKYFFRSANPMVEKIFDSQTIGNFVAKYSSCYISQSGTLKRTIVDRNYHTNVYISISLKKSNRNYTK